MLSSVFYVKCRKTGLYAGCHYAKCNYAECRYAECRGAALTTATDKYILNEPNQPNIYLSRYFKRIFIKKNFYSILYLMVPATVARLKLLTLG